MAILDILHFPDQRLRRRAAPVAQVDETVRQLIENMFETMYAAPGIGLAATQVNVPLRIVTIDVSEQRNEPLALINPEILLRSGEEEMEEGCLSVPGYFDVVQRAEFVTVRARNPQGQGIELETGGLLAVCIQHEIDHLDGKLFVDYLSEIKRQRLRKKIDKESLSERSAPRHALSI